MKMVCQKCGHECDRVSNCQRFCVACTPHRRKPSASATMKCEKCGRECERNSNRQRWCRECSSAWYPRPSRPRSNPAKAAKMAEAAQAAAAAAREREAQGERVRKSWLSKHGHDPVSRAAQRFFGAIAMVGAVGEHAKQESANEV